MAESPMEADIRLSRVKSNSGISAALKPVEGTLDQYEEPMTNTSKRARTSNIHLTRVFWRRRRKREDVECAPYLERGACARLSIAIRTVFLVLINGRSSSLDVFGSFMSLDRRLRPSASILFTVCGSSKRSAKFFELRTHEKIGRKHGLKTERHAFMIRIRSDDPSLPLCFGPSIL